MVYTGEVWECGLIGRGNGLKIRGSNPCRFESGHSYHIMDNLFKENILILYPKYSSVLGPYKRKDNRQHIVLNDISKSKSVAGKTRTISYPKAIMEVFLGRLLVGDETVDHIDGDFTNNNINNLQVLSRVDNAFKSTIRVEIQTNCPYCNKAFILSKDQRKSRCKGNKKFCSKKCSGLYYRR